MEHAYRRPSHRLSFQLSGAQLGISVTTLAAGYLTDPMVEDLPHPWLDAIGIPDRVGDAVMAFLVLVIVTSVSMVFGELVPKYLAVARPLSTARFAARDEMSRGARLPKLGYRRSR